MKIVIYSRPGIQRSREELEALLTAAESSGMDYCVNSDFAAFVREQTGLELPDGRLYRLSSGEVPRGDVAVSYGGDGTFLECVRMLGINGLPVFGVNSGRLGFLASVPKEDIAQAFAKLSRKEYKTLPRPLLEVEGIAATEENAEYAFNEFSIQRSGAGMIAVEAFIDGEMVGTCWGDGVLLSTPAGSTAYSLSVGGPIVVPGCGCFVLSPIASHNLTMRPVVVPDTSTVTLRLASREGAALASLDSSSHEAVNGASFTIKKSTKSVSIIELYGTSFYDTLRNKMMWGFDRRKNDSE